MVTPIHISPPYVLKLNYEFDFECLKNKIEETVSYTKNSNAKHELEQGDSTSTNIHNVNGQPHEWKESRHFINYLFQNMESILDQMDLMKWPISIKGSWINHHGYGGQTLEHNHGMMDIVMACYIKCPENSGNIMFRDPLEYHRSSTYSQSFINQDPTCFWPYVEIPVKTNDIIVFPGWLWHKTQASNTEEDRYVMTINWKFEPPTFNRQKDKATGVYNYDT